MLSFLIYIFSFGENNVTTTTQRLPIEALGDRDLVDRLSKLPKENQPFWLLNWQALEEQRKNPQTYPQRPSHFGQPLNGFNSGSQFSSGTSGSSSDTTSGNTDTANNNSGSTNSETTNFNETSNDSAALNNNPINVLPEPATSNRFENRFGNDDTNSDTTRITAGQILTPTYPLYAHVDDVLSNRYVPSKTSQTTASNNKPTSKNLAKEKQKLELLETKKIEDTSVFNAPSVSMFRQPILDSSFDDDVARPFDIQSEYF